MDDTTRTEIEAAAFRRLVAHFRERTEVQNIDLMELAGFCRNCLSKWYAAEAETRGETVSYDEAREIVYGMPYAEWKAKHQAEQPPQPGGALLLRREPDAPIVDVGACDQDGRNRVIDLDVLGPNEARELDDLGLVVDPEMPLALDPQ